MDFFREDNKELTPVSYSPAAIKVLHFNVDAHNACFRIHWHERLELLRVHEGVLYVENGSNIFEVNSGELILLPPKMPHKGYTKDRGVRYDVIMFDVRSFYNDSELCELLLPAIFNGRAKFHIVTADEEILSCTDMICANWSKKSLSLTAGIYWLLHLYYERCLIEIKDESDDDATIQNIISYIENHFSEDISTSSLCVLFGYSATHFGRKFKEATGLSPMAYLRIYRMEEAYRLLKMGKYNISEIALKCGFSDANYFTRCFKSHFGCAPTRMK